jgi:Na+-transporting methylmalonyl-CoA/oxaloacetate decarboxylase gamma subunit
MLHEWISGTRVVRLPERDEPRRLKVPETATLLKPATVTQLGPYAIQGSLLDTPERTVLVGVDRGLERPVWIDLRPLDAPPLSQARRDLNRSTRLRWLASGVEGERQWDAFVFVSGAPLTTAVAPGRPLSWEVTRPLLDQLAAELGGAVQDGTLPATLSVDQLWAQPDGRLILLDAPLVGWALPTIEASRWAVPTLPSVIFPVAGTPDDEQTALALVGQTAVLTLEGQPRSAKTSQGPIRTPLPISARTLLDPLVGVGKPYRSLADLQGWIQHSRAQPSSVNRLRRAAQLLLLAACVFMAGLGVVMFLSVIMVMVMNMITRLNAARLEQVLQDYQRVQAAEMVLSTASAQDPASAFALAVGLPHDELLMGGMRSTLDQTNARIKHQQDTAGPITAAYLGLLEPQIAMQKSMLASNRRRTDLRDQAPWAMKEVANMPCPGRSWQCFGADSSAAG